MEQQDRRFFLKYGDYSTGMRLTIRGNGHNYLIEHNVAPESGDKHFDGDLQSFQDFQKLLKDLYPEKWNPILTHGENWFIIVFHELFHQVERYKRKYPTQRAKARRRKTPHKK